jgi:farnesol dehydrogenase
MISRILVTGATGFVGRRLVPRLLAEGRCVRVLVRDATGLSPGLRSRVEIVLGSLSEDEVLDRAVRGCSAVLNLAALARAWTRDPEDYHRINARAVQIMLEAASRHGVERFVQVSSVAALPPVRFARRWGVGQRPTAYGQSKTASELLVRQYVAAGGQAVIVRPSRVYGPGPWTDANATTRLMALYLSGRLRVRLSDQDVEANYVHVDDVVRGLQLALEHGRPGRAYNLGGENTSLKDFLGTVAAVAGVRRRVVPLPPQLILPFARLAPLWGRLGGQVAITPEWLNNFLEHRPQDIETSREDLGYEPRSLVRGVTQTLAWLERQEGGDRCVNGAIRCLRRAQA